MKHDCLPADHCYQQVDLTKLTNQRFISSTIELFCVKCGDIIHETIGVSEIKNENYLYDQPKVKHEN